MEGRWDRSRLEQVLVNLLTNAMKYAPGAPLEVRLGRTDALAILSVRDGGPGIPAAEHARLFEPFERASTSRGVGGLGLGLYLVDQIVRAHRGALRLESDRGQGCRFTALLPLDAALQPAPVRRSRPTLSPVQRPSLPSTGVA